MNLMRSVAFVMATPLPPLSLTRCSLRGQKKNAFSAPKPRQLSISTKIALKRVQLSSESVRKAVPSNNGMMTDSSVPEGHQGLHSALYGEEGAEIHSSGKYNFRKGEDDGDAIVPFSAYLESRDGEKPLGVYAVYDSDHNIQYIGYSRNIVLALKKHRKALGDDVCAFVRVMVFMNKAMTSRENLEREALDWMEHEGTLPPGNGAERELWEDVNTLGVTNMSSDERREYEEKKNKLKKAMGANLHDDVPGESLESKERRLRLVKAVEGDNWSAVIDEQTKATESDGRHVVTSLSAGSFADQACSL